MLLAVLILAFFDEPLTTVELANLLLEAAVALGTRPSNPAATDAMPARSRNLRRLVDLIWGGVWVVDWDSDKSIGAFFWGALSMVVLLFA
jgi:hypothetical protein